MDRASRTRGARDASSRLARTVVITGAAAGAAAAHVTARWQCPTVAKPFTGAELLRAIASLPKE